MKTITVEDSIALIPDGTTLMVGGFIRIGTPECIVNEFVGRERSILQSSPMIPQYPTAESESSSRRALLLAPSQAHRPQSRDTVANDRGEDGCLICINYTTAFSVKQKK